MDDDEFLQSQFSYFFLTQLAPQPAGEEKDTIGRQYFVTMDHYNKYLLNYLFTPKRIGETGPDNDELPPLTRDFIETFSQHLKSSVELYFKLSTPEQSDWTAQEKIQLERIGRLRGHSPSPLLLALYRQENNAEKRVRFLVQFEKYCFFNSFGQRNSALYGRRIYASDPYIKYATRNINTEGLTSYIENAVAEIFKETPLHEHLSDWVKNGHGYYGWHSIKYFLYEYELYLQGKTKSKRVKINWKEFSKENYRDDYQSIEHIYPQRARDQYWTERFSQFSPTQKRLLRNSLGNLLALSVPRNSSLSNKSFPEKLGDDQSMTGYRYGSYSENEVATFPEWGPGQIVERGIHLLSFLEKRWNLPATDNQQKLKALGLNFLAKKNLSSV